MFDDPIDLSQQSAPCMRTPTELRGRADWTHRLSGRTSTVCLLALLAVAAALQTGCGGQFQPAGTSATTFTNPSSGSGGGTLTVPPPAISVVASITSASVAAGGQLKLTVSVENATNPDVVWAVNDIPGGNLTVGTISSNGTYIAPPVTPTPNTVIITATSVQDPSKRATIIVVLATPPPSATVAVSPSLVTLQTGATTVFTATVTGATSTAVTWRVNGIVGGNSTLGTITPTGVYTAPAIVPSPANVTIEADSVADPNASGFAAVTVQQRVQVSVTPISATVLTNATQQFTATVTAAVNQNVTWRVNGILGGNATVGTISASGLYTAPASVSASSNIVTVSATSVQDTTATAFATVTLITFPAVTVAVSPVTGTLLVNQTLQFTATVTGLFRGVTPSQAVTWQVGGVPGGNSTVGTISASGLYTAPRAVPFPNTVTITAFSVTDPSVSASATLLITAPAVVSVVVSPSSAAVQVSGAQQFTATVSGTTNQTVTWAVNGVTGGNTLIGTVTSTGRYTAPTGVPSPATVNVSATSTVDPSASAAAQVTVVAAPVPIAVSVSPATASLHVTAQLQFAASVTGTSNTAVTWKVNGIVGGNSTLGTISVSGLYTAPANVPVPSTVQVSATSVADPTKSTSTSVVILAASTISMTPATTTVQVGLGVQFFVTLTGLTNLAVNYAVNGVLGGNSTLGTISSTGLYLVPTNVPTSNPVVITATSVADPTLVAQSTVAIVQPVTVAVNPGTVTIALSATQSFTATVTGTTNQVVSWRVNGITGGNSTVGTISAAGLYTPPANLLLTQTLTISAVSAANPNQTGSAALTVTVPVAVALAPSTASIGASNTQQFTATVTGTANAAVNFSISGTGCTGAACGSISSTGLYTSPAAPPSPATVTVRATSVADPTKSATSSVTVTAPVVTISLTPTTASVATGTTQQLTATVTGTANTNVTFTLSGAGCTGAACGTINSLGVYTAPGAVPSPASVTVTATSVADPTKSATSTLTITATPITIAINPTTASVSTSGTQQFTTTITGSTNTSVTFALSGSGCSGATCGTISAAGLYTAPPSVPSPATVTVTATSVADPSKSATATVTVISGVAVSLSPSTANVLTGATQQFTATVTGTTNTAVTFSLSGTGCSGATCGTISAAGLYTGPASVPSPATVTVRATSAADTTKSATSTVTVTSAVAVSLSPSNATVQTGRTQQFTATVTGTTNTSVTFTLTGTGCSGATCGTITSGGLYTAPATAPSPNSVTVRATSVADPTKSASATVTLQAAIVVAIAPTATTLATTQTQQFTATVTGTTNTAVTWQVNGIVGGNSTVGTISTTGLYTAPTATPTPSTLTVQTLSVADPTKTASANVTIASPPVGAFVVVFPVNQGLPVGRTQQFTALVIRSVNQAVTWNVSCTAASCGTVSTSGVYTPPTSISGTVPISVTATSVADPTAFLSANATVVAGVTVSPASAKILISQTRQFTATVTGVGNSAVTWAVNGVVGGNVGLGTISATGLYTAPSAVPSPGLLSITATSVADPTEPGVATATVLARTVQVFAPVRPALLGAHQIMQASTQIYPTTTTGAPVVTWSTTAGSITPAGVLTAPTVAGPVTVTARSTVDTTISASIGFPVLGASVNSSVALVNSLTKVRPYNWPDGQGSLSFTAARNQYASWQVNVQADQEDLTGVDVSVSDFVSISGGRIPGSSAVMYFEKMINVANPTRAQGDTGEWPDALIPKVDPFVGETRNAFPFTVNRISPAYRIFPRSGGDTVNTGMGGGRAISGGTFAGTMFEHFVVTIDRSGSVGTATFKWSNNGGTTFQATGVPTSTSPTALSDGVTVSFQNSAVGGVPDFVAGDNFWIFGGPLRNQPVWIDLFVPPSVPADIYTGSVTVVRAGKAPVTLNINMTISSYTLPVTSSVPSYFGMSWTDLLNAHFGIASGPQLLSLGQLYGTACLINRISCETGSAFPPVFTFNPDGTVATKDDTAYVQATAPLANGSITPHGEQLTSLRMPRGGLNTSEQYFATQSLMQTFTTQGWASRVFDYSFDEPTSPADFLAAMNRTSIVRAASPSLRALVTTDISQSNYNLIGYVNRWSPPWTTIERKEFLDGPNTASRAFYNQPIAQGDELWWYESCLTHGCTQGTSPRHDNTPSFTIDTNAELNRAWGLQGAGTYLTKGFLYQNSVLAYSRFYNMSAPQIDVWDSVYYLGGNGDGTLFYPGRPSLIGGATHIPIESLRLKQIRDAMVDQELGFFLTQRGDQALVQQEVVIQSLNNLYTQNPDIAVVIGAYADLLNLAGPTVGFLPRITVPAASGLCYNDPVSGNRVCRVTDNTICDKGGFHYYSYWPVWNATGTHLLASCDHTVGPFVTTTMLLFRDVDLANLGDALVGAPGLSTNRTPWSRVDPNIFFAQRGTQVWQWNPFTHTGQMVGDFAGTTVSGVPVSLITLAYVSFDDRYLLAELLDPTFAIIGLGVYDRQAGRVIGVRDLNTFPNYDESVMAKDNSVIVVLVGDSLHCAPDFSTCFRYSDAGHHAHGLLPDGTSVSSKPTNNQCPTSSISGTPTFKPAATVVTHLTGVELLLIGCNDFGFHEFAHYSWNNVQTDRFFSSTWQNPPNPVGPIDDAIDRIRLQFNPPVSHTVVGHTIDFLAHHRTEKRWGYGPSPRASCNQQGTRCIFGSAMTLNTNNVDPTPHVYVVDVP